MSELTEIRIFHQRTATGNKLYFTAHCPVQGRRVRCEVGPVEDGHRILWSCPSRFERQSRGTLTSKRYTAPPTRETRLSVGNISEDVVKMFMDNTDSTIIESKDESVSRDLNH